MLELVSIGVFGACLSALLCMITEGTPYEVPKVISFEDGLLRPKIIRSVNWPKWTTASYRRENDEKRKNVYRAHQCGCQKRHQDVRNNNRGQDVQTSVPFLKCWDKAIDTKMISNARNVTEEKDALYASPDRNLKCCKYCGNAEISEAKSIRLRDKSLMRKSVSRLKNALQNRKNEDYDSCADCKRLYDEKWRKVRTKKRRFVLPKSLVIEKKMDNYAAPEKIDFLDDPIDRQIFLNERYCYLEALRIKINKVEKNP